MPLLILSDVWYICIYTFRQREDGLDYPLMRETTNAIKTAATAANTYQCLETLCGRVFIKVGCWAATSDETTSFETSSEGSAVVRRTARLRGAKVEVVVVLVISPVGIGGISASLTPRQLFNAGLQYLLVQPRQSSEKLSKVQYIQQFEVPQLTLTSKQDAQSVVRIGYSFTRSIAVSFPFPK